MHLTTSPIADDTVGHADVLGKLRVWYASQPFPPADLEPITFPGPAVAGRPSAGQTIQGSSAAVGVADGVATAAGPASNVATSAGATSAGFAAAIEGPATVEGSAAVSVVAAATGGTTAASLVGPGT